MDRFESLIRQKGQCCISDKPMLSSGHINMLEIAYYTSWEYPKGGNFLTGEKDIAIAVVHDDCIEDGALKGEVKFAIEISKNDIIYHPVNSLKKRRYPWNANLSASNFFEGVESKFPDAVAHFSAWLDNYKKEVEWPALLLNAEFVDLPFEMQYGILSRYAFEQKHNDRHKYRDACLNYRNDVAEMFSSIQDRIDLANHFSKVK